MTRKLPEIEETLEAIAAVKRNFRRLIEENFAFAAQDCQSCSTFGACCTDEHFVNVHITFTEALAIIEHLQNYDSEERRKIYENIWQVIEKNGLSEDRETFTQTFACPLFDKQRGCLLHFSDTKPLPCIAHGCYEKREDVPPDELRQWFETKIVTLDRTFSRKSERVLLPLPLMLKQVILNAASDKEIS